MTSWSDTEGLQVAPPHPGLEYHDHSSHHALKEAHTPYTEGHYKGVPNAETPIGLSALRQDTPEKRTCGLRRRTFWLLTALLTLAIIAAAVGGGVGGSLTNKDKSNTATSSIAQASPSSSPAPSATGASQSTDIVPPTSSIQTPTSTSTIVGPSATLFRDCPSSNDTIYPMRLGSAEQQYRKLCNVSFVATKSNDENFVNQFALSLNDCIGLCAQWNINDHVSTSGLVQTCGAVCWRNSFDDDHPGSCFGYAVSNSSAETFQLNNDTRCDSAAWINEP